MLKLSKCHFLCQSIEFLGHVIIPASVGPNPKQFIAIKELPTTQTLSQVRMTISQLNVLVSLVSSP